MAFYLNSFHPLCSTKLGRIAVVQHKLQPYIDGSCRREPDLENQFPAITSLCRPKFVSRLEEGDRIAYFTIKKGMPARKLVAILTVIKLSATHIEAKLWYDENGCDLPNNLMVPANSPIPLDKTHQKMGWDLWVKGANSLAEWDLAYQVRAEENEKVAICKVLFLELKDPFSLNENFIQKIFGWFPGTQTPRILRANELRRFKVWLSFKGIQIH